MIAEHGVNTLLKRRMPVGAEIHRGGTHFRIWAPERRRIEVVFEGRESKVYPMVRHPSGYFETFVEGAGAGARYRYRLDGARSFPDPASRFQPLGPHGPSEIVDGRAFEWSDAAWPGIAIAGQVLYEMHVGTFTPEGTWSSAIVELPALADTGVTCIELMPVSEFPGRFGWGYDGTLWFAPTHLYGVPDDFRRFVDRAHALSIGVILDVVYNHFGP